MQRRDEVLAVLGDGWRRRDPFAIGRELFRRILEHPEGVHLATLPVNGHLERAIEYPDGKIRLMPEPMAEELRRLLDDPSVSDEADESALVLAAGFRTRWTANTIHRDPSWRKGRGPHCTLRIHPQDAKARHIEDGALVRVETAAGSAELPAEIDEHVLPGQVAIPNGFGMAYPNDEGELVRQGINLNQLTSAEHRDRFTGIPLHKCVPCRVERLATDPERAAV